MRNICSQLFGYRSGSAFVDCVLVAFRLKAQLTCTRDYPMTVGEVFPVAQAGNEADIVHEGSSSVG